MGGQIMKKYLNVLFLLAIVFLIIFNINCDIDYSYIDAIDYCANDLNVEFVRSEDNRMFSELDLEKYNIDFEKNDIIISYGRRIKKIAYEKECFLVNSGFVEIVLEENFEKNRSHIYLIPKDLHFNEKRHTSTFIKIEGDK